MKTFSKEAFEFRETRIVCGNKGVAVGMISRLGEPDSMRMEGTGNSIGYGG